MRRNGCGFRRGLSAPFAALVASASAAGNLSEREFADVVCSEVADLLAARGTALQRIDGEHMTPATAETRPLRLHLPVEVVPGVAAQVVATGKFARIDDYPSLGGELAARAAADGFDVPAIGAPLFIEGKLWGAQSTATGVAGGFALEAEQSLEQFAGLVSTALANAQAQERLGFRARLLGDAARGCRRLAVRRAPTSRSRQISLPSARRSFWVPRPAGLSLRSRLDHRRLASTDRLRFPIGCHSASRRSSRRSRKPASSRASMTFRPSPRRVGACGWSDGAAARRHRAKGRRARPRAGPRRAAGGSATGPARRLDMGPQNGEATWSESHLRAVRARSGTRARGRRRTARLRPSRGPATSLERLGSGADAARAEFEFDSQDRDGATASNGCCTRSSAPTRSQPDRLRGTFQDISDRRRRGDRRGRQPGQVDSSCRG